MTTNNHSQYWAHALTLKSASDSVQNLSRSIANARVDVNPHQFDAALFAFRSPLAKGAILADEVGLGKTIEAGGPEGPEAAGSRLSESTGPTVDTHMPLAGRSLP